jgi:hypothetical protein
MIFSADPNHILKVFSVKGSETQLEFSKSYGCHPSDTCRPAPQLNPKRDSIFSAVVYVIHQKRMSIAAKRLLGRKTTMNFGTAILGK